MPFSLQGKTVLITGAGGGIGSQTAQVCAELGADLVLADQHTPEKLAESLRTQGISVGTLAFDVTDRAATQAAIARTGRIDAVVVNAGICPWDDWNDADWDAMYTRVMDINLHGMIHLTRCVLAKMTAQGQGGKIVLLASVAGRVGGIRTSAHYVTSKSAVIGFTKWLARRAAPAGVMVNGVAPGIVETTMIQDQPFDPSTIPLGRFAHPREIALPIAFLCSDGADYICGTTLDVNGGVYMN